MFVCVTVCLAASSGPVARHVRVWSMDGWLPIIVMILLGAGFAGVGVLASQFLVPKNPTPEKLAPYECGVPPVGDARERMSVKFYLVAMLFILFDIEVVFLYPWAVIYRDMLKESGGLILGSMISFLVILFVGYLYALKKRAFDWKG